MCSEFTGARRSAALRLVVTAGFVLLAVLGFGAVPASAHTVGGSGATDFVTTLDALTPPVPGLTLAVVENGTKLELVNHSGADVVVEGYVGDQYLRVGPAGVFVNTQSPAAYLNDDRWGRTPVPAGVDPGAAPVWKKVSGDAAYRWHDHRIHWMSTTLPPAVRAAPGQRHEISTWTVTLHREGVALTATGRLVWVPGPGKAVWLSAVGVVLVGTAVVCGVGGGRGAVGARGTLRARRGFAAALAVLVASDVVHSAGVAGDSVAGLGAQAGRFFAGNVIQLAAWGAAGVATWLLLRRRGDRVRAGAVWLGAGAGLLLALASGVPDVAVLWSSTAPFAGPVGVARGLVAVVLGVGFGVGAAAPWYLRRTRGLLAGPAARAEAEDPASAPQQAGSAAAAATHTDPDRIAPAADDPQRVAAATVADESMDSAMSSAPSREPAAAGHAPARPTDRIDPPVSPSRRLFLTTGVGGVVAGAATTALLVEDRPEPATPAAVPGLGTVTVSAPSPHQPGIHLPARQQAHGTVAAFDLAPSATAAQLKALLQAWTAAIADLTAGRPAGNAPDTDIATGVGPSSLTITVGVGPSLFGKAGLDAATRPAQLTPLPAFGAESLDPARSDGDLGVVIAADDALVVFHALRTLTRLAAGTAAPRWTMNGFTRTPGAAADDAATGRNLMGQLDGTNNPRPDAPDFAAKVYVPPSAGPAWMRGGSYLVVRRIRMLLDSWEQVPAAAQERVIGRRKSDGAPLSGGAERTPVDMSAQNPDGSLAVAPDAHIRLAAPAANDGAAMLRRGLSYSDGLTPDGHPDAGLLFLAYQADPARGFIPVQQRLTRGMDALNRFIKHESSALFAMLPAAGSGYLGQALLEPGTGGAAGSAIPVLPGAAAVTLPATVGDGGTGSAVAGADGIQRITVTADDTLRYHPSIIEMRPGTIEITVVNAGGLPHTMSEAGPPLPGEPAAGVAQLAGGGRTTMSLRLETPGDYPFQCGYHAAEGMYAVIRVR